MASQQSLIVRDTNLQSYLKNLRHIKMLTLEEEYNLALQWVVYKNARAAQALVISFLPLVVKIASKYKNYGQSINDLISEGSIGLMKAVSKFDPQKGFRLATYAMWWIKAYITEYILNSYSLVKQGSIHTRKKLFFSLKRIKQQLGFSKAQLSLSEAAHIASDAAVTVDEVNSVNDLLEYRDLSLDKSLYEEQGGSVVLGDTLAGTEDTPENITIIEDEDRHNKSEVLKALTSLNPREKFIVEQRFLLEKPRSLSDIGQELQISRERVRQIEVKALQKAHTMLIGRT